jgi:hypothetical protein
MTERGREATNNDKGDERKDLKDGGSRKWASHLEKQSPDVLRLLSKLPWVSRISGYPASQPVRNEGRSTKSL